MRPAQGMVPDRFFQALAGCPNVIQLLISATPWNAITKDSAIPQRHVVSCNYDAESPNQHSLSAGEIVLIEKGVGEMWEGYVEGRFGEGKKLIKASCLDPEELHVISWDHRTRCAESFEGVNKGEVLKIEQRTDDDAFDVRNESGALIRKVKMSQLQSALAQYMNITRTLYPF